MAMRLYTKAELEEELTNLWNLTPTETVTATQTFWRTPRGNLVPFVTLEDNETYPDSLIEELLKRVAEIDSQ